MENLIKFTTFLNHSTLLEPAGCRLAKEISQGRRAKSEAYLDLFL